MSNTTVKNESTTEESEDLKISCTNMRSIREIIQIVSLQISDFAESSDLGDEKEQFISRFMSVFKEAIEENITINDLPCFIDKNALTSDQKQSQAEVIDNALAARLSDTVSTVASKRKHCPKECVRILDIKLKAEREQLKRMKFEYSPTVVPPSLLSDSDAIAIDQFTNLAKNCKAIQEEIQKNINEAKKIKSNLAFANTIKQKNV